MQPVRPVERLRRGSALVVVLWILTIVALIVGTFAFEMQLEARIITLQRKRFKADRLALAGMELAKTALAVQKEAAPSGEKVVLEDPFLDRAARIKEGNVVEFSEPLGGGTVRVRIESEKGRRNIRTLRREEWRELFDQAGVPNSRWDPLLDCLADWQDEDDLHQLNGAESDDPFYRERGYPCKNAPIDTVDELLLIKEWTPELLYGTPPDEATDEPVAGLAKLLTVWGDGKVNPNSATREVLNSLNLTDTQIEEILDAKDGPDREPGTEDDGISANDFTAMGLSGELFSLPPQYVAVTSVGEVEGVQSTISCIFELGEKESVPVFWTEGKKSE